MSELNKGHMPTDEQLTAFIDGELDAADREWVERLIAGDARVAERFDFLSRSALPFEEAFEPMLAEAPAAKLEAMLAAVTTAKKSKARAAGIGRRGFLAAVAASFVAAIAIDRAVIGLGRRLSKPDEDTEWRAAVAEYLSLYTADTLSAPAGDHVQQVAQLNEVSMKLGLSLAPEAVAMPGVEFKRAQILNYDNKPLAQIAYLDPESGPMALCIVQSAKGAAAPDMESRRGMNVVYWSSATHAFMLIGHAPIDRMQQLAADVMARLVA
ncbi:MULTISPECIES: anti-sigma factor family protein [Rhizobium]|uniref:Transmembrane transcriptional regulator (Anti-sigma factor RsiW) n=1 Tax=Rhizobium miluonense TaxID=411945 RepID=A0A1C3VYG7_9HYPH|nr:anti-sigma factor [Rhizobium miluonense]SCB32850.1 Transmembrane transcriptional regulator (anti-sigma factor RsiW) [Rhizobium miluonense]